MRGADAARRLPACTSATHRQLPRAAGCPEAVGEEEPGPAGRDLSRLLLDSHEGWRQPSWPPHGRRASGQLSAPSPAGPRGFPPASAAAPHCCLPPVILSTVPLTSPDSDAATCAAGRGCLDWFIQTGTHAGSTQKGEPPTMAAANTRPPNLLGLSNQPPHLLQGRGVGGEALNGLHRLSQRCLVLKRRQHLRGVGCGRAACFDNRYRDSKRLLSFLCLCARFRFKPAGRRRGTVSCIFSAGPAQPLPAAGPAAASSGLAAQLS